MANVYTKWRRYFAESFNSLSRTHERYRRQTDDRRICDGKDPNVMACSHRRRGRDRTVLSCLQLCLHRQRPKTRQFCRVSNGVHTSDADQTKLIETDGSRQDKTILSAV